MRRRRTPPHAASTAFVDRSIDRAVKSAQQGQKIWAAMTAMERSRILRRAVDILRERNDELAKLETLDTGKAYSETSTVDIVTGADVLEYYAGLIDHNQLISSIKDKLLPLGDDVTFIPGHGPLSTLGYERLHNPFLQDEMPVW